jgi:hypothetical protein
VGDLNFLSFLFLLYDLKEILLVALEAEHQPQYSGEELLRQSIAAVAVVAAAVEFVVELFFQPPFSQLPEAVAPSATAVSIVYVMLG